MEQLTEMAKRLQIGAKPENIVYTGPKRKAKHNVTIPEESTTEVAFYNMNNSISKERIVAILGGGNKIRMVRQTEKLTFVSCWTPGDPDLLLRFGLQKLRRAGVSVTTVQRTRFRIDCHNHEIDEGAPCPPYEPYSQQEERHDHGQMFPTPTPVIRAKVTASGGSGEFKASMVIEEKARKRSRSGSRSD